MALTQKINRLDSVADDFLSKIPAAQTQVYDQVVELLSRLTVVNGQFELSAANLRIASEISALLKDALLASEYTPAVTEFIGQFDKQAVINDALLRASFPAFTTSELATQVLNVSKRNAIELLMNYGADSNFVAPLRDIIEQAVVNNAGYRETLANIRDFLEGSGPVDGVLVSYSKLYAHDAFAVADRSYVAAVSQEIGAEWFRYVGNTIATTRPFCRQRYGQFFHKKEIEGWFDIPPKLQPDITTPNGKGEWAGKIDSEDQFNFYSYAGGYNCRHVVQPVSQFAVPAEVIERVRAEGYII